ncbi:hypothetical protein Ciccas_006035 [Cichlidogyrus casuarinus]|uniref:Uncharacterized protein n=1 Tax=Cichlidogyrus casuarinus TaxID=1844966 RepID=A0ABD2Q6Y5_9PLAT
MKAPASPYSNYSPAKTSNYQYDQEDEAIMRPGQPGMAATLVPTYGNKMFMPSPSHQQSPMNTFRASESADFGEMRSNRPALDRQSSPEIQPLLEGSNKQHSPDQHHRMETDSIHSLKKSPSNAGSVQTLNGQQRGPITMPRSGMMSHQESYDFGEMTPQHMTPRSESQQRIGTSPPLSASLSPKDSSLHLVEQQKREATDALFGLIPRTPSAQV